jgi:hypothetical protein
MAWESSYYDSQHIFLRGIIARDIAEPLISFDATTPAEAARAVMAELNQDAAGVSENLDRVIQLTHGPVVISEGI